MNKQLYLLLTLFFCVNRMFAQDNQFSLQADVNYYHYIISENALGKSIQNEPSFGFSLLGSYYTGHFKITSGLNMAQKNVYYMATPDESNQLLTKRSYHFGYINLPVLLSYKLQESKTSSWYLTGGLIFGGVRKYNYISEYQNRPTVAEEVNSYGCMAITTRVGLEYSQHLSNHFRVNISPFMDIKTIPDEYDNDGAGKYQTYVGKNFGFGWDRLSFGARLGFEYVF